MTGSGPQDRDESLTGVTTLKPFALIADALSSAGVGVLRYDDRGVGASTGTYAGATISQLASDGSAAVDYVSTRDDIDVDRIGVLGHSEGGFYAAMIVPDDPRISFAVLMAPPTVNGVDLILAQNEAKARAAGSSPEEIEVVNFAAEVALPAAVEGDRATIEAVISIAVGRVWDDANVDARALLGDRDAFIEQQVEIEASRVLSDWFRSLLAYDPQPDLAHMTVPVLGLFGAKDVQVVLEQNEPALREALEAAGNDDFEIIVFPNGNHLFQEAITGAVGEYSELAPEFTPDFLPSLVDWVLRHTDSEPAA
jgi:pimeloyl-ACP methyl ester carboxylesterase